MKQAIVLGALLLALPGDVLQSDVRACRADYFRFCVAHKSLEGITDCLIRNRSHLRTACQKVLVRHGK